MKGCLYRQEDKEKDSYAPTVLVTYTQGLTIYSRWGEYTDEVGPSSIWSREWWQGVWKRLFTFLRGCKKEQALPSIIICLFNWSCLKVYMASPTEGLG